MKGKMILLSICALMIFSWVGSPAYSVAQIEQPSSQPEADPAIYGWRQVNKSGFGDPEQFFINRMAVFNNALFAGTRSDTVGGQVWYSEDGTTWAQATGGFDKLANIAMLVGDVISETLYLGTHNPFAGAEIWRTTDGTSWEQVADGGIDNAANYTAERIVVYKNMIYATFNNDSTGAEVWRSATGDDGSWTQANADGFGDSNNTGLWAVEVFDDYLYAAAAQINRPEPTGVEVWRTNDGTTWAQVNEDGFGYPDMINPWMESFQDYLYFTAGTPETGSQIWRCAHCDNTDWEQVVTDGFGKLTNQGGNFLIEYKGSFYAGTANSATGTELYQTSEGTHWRRIMAGGFDSVYNSSILSGAVFNGELYLGTLNNNGWLVPADGAEIWEKFPDLMYLPLVKR